MDGQPYPTGKARYHGAFHAVSLRVERIANDPRRFDELPERLLVL